MAEEETKKEQLEQSKTEAKEETKKEDDATKQIQLILALGLAVMVFTPMSVLFAVDKLMPEPVVKETQELAYYEVPLPELEINVSDTLGTRYARIGLVVTVSDKSMEALFKEYSADNPRGMLRKIQATAHETTSGHDLSALLSPKGKQMLKNQLRVALNDLLSSYTEGMVLDIYFEHYLIQ